MAGYSATPLDRKVGIKPGQRIVVRDAPPGWPIGATSTKVGEADVVIGFYRSRAGLERDAGKLPAQLPKTAMWWVAWPRKAAGPTANITRTCFKSWLRRSEPVA